MRAPQAAGLQTFRGKTTTQADHTHIHQQTASVPTNRFQINHTSKSVKMVWEYKGFLRREQWNKWGVRGKRRRDRRSQIREIYLYKGPSWEGVIATEAETESEETRRARARRLNADFRVELLATPTVNFPPCLLELPLTRRWTDKQDRTLHRRKLQQTAANLIFISHLHSDSRHTAINTQVSCRLRLRPRPHRSLQTNNIMQIIQNTIMRVQL